MNKLIYYFIINYFINETFFEQRKLEKEHIKNSFYFERMRFYGFYAFLCQLRFSRSEREKQNDSTNSNDDTINRH